ncbi:MAG: hypothetical protein L0229_09905, partial [Blastocatellia bacterium]|nr:hypothetical protein [Blastocatellia bacterium]
SAAFPQMSGFKEEERGLSTIFRYDLKTGKLVKRYDLPDGSKGHAFGDLTLAPSGDVFISDSRSPVIYSITRKKDELEVFLKSERFVSLQGIDFSEDGKRLFVADYSRGIWAIDMASKKVSLLSQPDDVCMLGIDGLYFYKGGFVAIQNGTNPHRIIRLYLNGGLNEIERLEVIEANNPVFDEPTLGVLIKDRFYYIANSQWRSVDEKGNLSPADKLREPVVLKTRL